MLPAQRCGISRLLPAVLFFRGLTLSDCTTKAPYMLSDQNGGALLFMCLPVEACQVV